MTERLKSKPRFQHQSPQTDAGLAEVLALPLEERRERAARVSAEIRERFADATVDGWTDWDSFTPQDAGRPDVTEEDPDFRSPTGDGSGRGTARSDAPTEKQLNFIRTLARERAVDVPEVKTKREASAAIDTLLAAPKAPKPEVKLPDVPAGHYAIESSGHNDLAFYRVDRPKGKWEGRTFVKLVVGGHPDRNVRRDHVAGILERIQAAGVEESARRYGREIGRCCRCNRSLTDEASRKAGIGPDCASREA